MKDLIIKDTIFWLGDTAFLITLNGTTHSVLYRDLTNLAKALTRDESQYSYEGKITCRDALPLPLRVNLAILPKYSDPFEIVAIIVKTTRAKLTGLEIKFDL